MAELDELKGVANGWTIIGSMAIAGNILSPHAYLVHPLIAAILLIAGVGLRIVTAVSGKDDPRQPKSPG